ncbi:response regulator [Microcoleus sp. FACHB-68]|uniref:response regulator n=1 Tax=Microcoleus sp. FACHB-68 TaxID=2692826 RepID=UPI001687F826|nr:response regulator [Microcoleus sp. FACHB-68]MBD1937340.1 response regulator [Microcoleus sp. FACHB-68]
MVLESVGTNTQQLLGTRPLVLTVDDDEDNLLLMSQIIELFNCAFMGAENAGTGMALAVTHLPDMILLDMLLPDADGIEFVYQLKANQHTKNIPIIAVTALAREEDRQRFLAAGCTDYISKPFMLDALEEILCRHISIAVLS